MSIAFTVWSLNHRERQTVAVPWQKQGSFAAWLGRFGGQLQRCIRNRSGIRLPRTSEEAAGFNYVQIPADSSAFRGGDSTSNRSGEIMTGWPFPAREGISWAVLGARSVGAHGATGGVGEIKGSGRRWAALGCHQELWGWESLSHSLGAMNAWLMVATNRVGQKPKSGAWCAQCMPRVLPGTNGT